MTPPKKVTKYHSNGLPKYIGWVRGKTRVGQWFEMGSNSYGRVEATGRYADGLKTGVWLRYDWRRGHVYQEKFKNGKRVSRKNVGRINPKTTPGLKLGDFEAILKKLS